MSRMPKGTYGVAERVIVGLCRRAGRRTYATARAASVSRAQTKPPPTKSQYPPTQPPSHKPPVFLKSQLLRQYASLLRASPLLLIFQHNNLTANEWLALRRELKLALRKIDQSGPTTGPHIAEYTTIHTVQTGIFGAALRVVEYFKPELHAKSGSDNLFTHSLSRAAHEAAAKQINAHELTPLLSGQICVLAFPIVSPEHLREAISIISPSLPDFPPPKKRANPGWHDPVMQSAIQKLIFLGARAERKVFDFDGTKSISHIKGGLEGLQGELVALMQSLGAQLSNTLESASRNLYFTIDGRRSMLEDEEKAAKPK